MGYSNQDLSEIYGYGVEFHSLLDTISFENESEKEVWVEQVENAILNEEQVTDGFMSIRNSLEGRYYILLEPAFPVQLSDKPLKIWTGQEIVEYMSYWLFYTLDSKIEKSKIQSFVSENITEHFFSLH